MSKHPKLVANSWLTEPRVDDQNTVGESLTQQEFASDCDINVQIKRFQSFGVSPFQPFNADACADLSELSSDFIEAHNIIQHARDAFDDLDDRVKQRFHGSPALFLDFMSNLEANRAEALALGLINPPAPNPVPPPSKTPEGSETPQASTPAKGGE
nr:MAG: internal scaffolding protein [Microvirus sp.]